MKTLKQLREQLDLSQGDMARLLKVGRTTISLTESGQATLNIDALKKLAKLQFEVVVMEKSVEPTEVERNELEEYVRGYMLREQNCLYQGTLLQRKLQELDKSYEHNNCLLTLVAKLKKDGEYDPAWLDKLKASAKKKLSCCTVSKREKMRAQVALLFSEAAHIRQYLEENRNM